MDFGIDAGYPLATMQRPTMQRPSSAGSNGTAAAAAEPSGGIRRDR